jgi:hypothetical protein
MELESSLPYSQVPATCAYPESAPSSPNNPLPLPEDPSTMVIIYILIQELDNSDLIQVPRSNPDPDVFRIISCQDI